MKQTLLFLAAALTTGIFLVLISDDPPSKEDKNQTALQTPAPANKPMDSLSSGELEERLPISMTPEAGAPETLAEIKTQVTLRKNSTFYELLRNEGVSSQDILQIAAVAKPIKNLARLRSGTEIELYWQNEAKEILSKLVFEISKSKLLTIENSISGDQSKWESKEVILEVEEKEIAFQGIIKDSLWNSASEANLSPEVINQLAEVFAWQVDFSREVRVGDSWKILVRQRFVEGEFIGWGSIIVAEYNNNGLLYKASLFQSDGDQPSGYYEPTGDSLQRMFLKAPIKFARISSKFNRARFHPILKVRRPHLGVDYAAARGTPIMTTGDGRITFRGRKGGGGKTIIIKHNAIYKTAYNHMSRFHKKAKKGAKVKQGQVIGYVGTTGLSTGPHLHYEFYKRGRFIDPLKEKFPSAKPLPKKYRERFATYTTEKFEQLENYLLKGDGNLASESSKREETERL